MAKLIVFDKFVDGALTDELREKIRRAAAPEYRIAAFSALSAGEYADIEIAFGPFHKEQTDLMPNLRWQQLASAGAEGFIGNARERHILLTNATGAFGVSIAEHILSLMLAISRGLHHYRDHQLACEWKDAPFGKLLSDSTALIIGLGDIGLETAKRLKALNMRVLAVKRTEIKKPDCVDEIAFDLGASLDQMLSVADYAVLCLPLTDGTRHVLDARRLALMPDGAAVINIGRGALIDQDALVKELKAGRLSAGLDVTTPEPLPEENPLWQMRQCLITPHMSGRSTRSMPFITDVLIQNLARFRAGSELINIVDPIEGY